MVGFIVAAPSSGSGKTVATVGLLAALRDRGHAVQPAKAGPDYIDTAWLSAAAGRPAVNLDVWAMRPGLLAHLAAQPALVVEGVMGLFDGAQAGGGSTADLARTLGLPVVLVIDAGGMSQSVAALAHGFSTFDPTVQVAGVLLTRIASERHERLVRGALRDAGIACFGALPRSEDVAIPSRHLGLKQAAEFNASRLVARAGAIVAASVDLAALEALGAARSFQAANPEPLPPPGQRIAIADDEAFSFTYLHIWEGWRAAGATLHPFSPLAGESADADADAVVLPGGYPELHAGRLACERAWATSLANAARRGATVYGECGGYMALGETLIDADGVPHAMASLLPVTTSFQRRRRTLGYRQLVHDGTLFPRELRGHEFHYATVDAEGPPLFRAADASGVPLGPMGTRLGTVAGSFAHIIDHAYEDAQELAALANVRRTTSDE